MSCMRIVLGQGLSRQRWAHPAGAAATATVSRLPRPAATVGRRNGDLPALPSRISRRRRPPHFRCSHITGGRLDDQAPQADSCTIRCLDQVLNGSRCLDQGAERINSLLNSPTAYLVPEGFQTCSQHQQWSRPATEEANMSGNMKHWRDTKDDVTGSSSGIYADPVAASCKDK